MPSAFDPDTLEGIVWHQLGGDEACRRLAVAHGAGLSESEAAGRRDRFGPNRLPEAQRRGPWRLFLDQFRSVLILLLVGAAILAALVGHLLDASVILGVVLINATLGFRQEYRAERSMAALERMLAPQAEVRRAGRREMIPAEQLVPGDIVLLDAGDKVPADGRLLVAEGLEVDESTLTGESVPASKSIRPLDDPEVPLGDRTCIAFMNTVVTRGRGELVVTATGERTEMGRVARLLSITEQPSTPLQRQLDHLGRRLALVAGVLVLVVFVTGLVRGDPLLELALTSIALAVAGVPEGLPAVATVTLAVGMWRMAKRHAIVKRLSAVEALGGTTVICSDKTGTLTMNQMTVRRVRFAERTLQVSGGGYRTEGAITAGDGGPSGALDALLVPAVLCNDSHLRGERVVGDPTEAALLVLAAKAGLAVESAARALPRIAEIPFDSERKYMATFHRGEAGLQLFVKGAPEVLLPRCTHLLGADGIEPLADEQYRQVAEQNRAWAGEGFRLLTIARRELSGKTLERGPVLESYVEGLTLVGTLAMIDPLRPDAAEAVIRCREAGIQVKLVTGDNRDTAAAIAASLGLRGQAIDGSVMERMSDTELEEVVEETVVFARVSPTHKLRILHALKALGHTVAMTGDGVNDAPALKAADMGVAMGASGTDVAREAATMVLTDDNFSTIVAAVEEGRTIYANIVKFVRFQVSTNIGAISAAASAPLLGLPLPFNAVQILWVNIIMDGPPAMALGLDPVRPGSMQEPPRAASERIITWGRAAKLLIYGATMALGTLWVLYTGLESMPREQALTLAFTTFVLFQVFNVFNARAGERSAFGRYLFTNAKLWGALAVVVALQVVAVYWGPAQTIFRTVPIAPGDWLLATGVASSVLLLDEGRKLGQRTLRAVRRRG